jgi:hypothetical protein
VAWATSGKQFIELWERYPGANPMAVRRIR